MVQSRQIAELARAQLQVQVPVAQVAQEAQAAIALHHNSQKYWIIAIAIVVKAMVVL